MPNLNFGAKPAGPNVPPLFKSAQSNQVPSLALRSQTNPDQANQFKGQVSSQNEPSTVVQPLG